jgi:putative serine protease PepD
MSAMTRTAPLAAFGAVLALGAGGGAGAVALIGDSPAASTTTVTQRTPSAAVADVKTTGALTVNQIYRRTKSSVVEIRTGEGEGTGFVLDGNGDIVTNQHVVAGASTVQVAFAGGRKAKGRVVGSDASSDVAVVRVDVPASALKPLTFADSSSVQVGDAVVAIGSPYGLAGTVTTGIVSALDRTITSPSDYSITGALQTDAAINPGNSGGPLLDAAGRVIGVNAQIESSSRGNTGVGFALAGNAVRKVAEQIVAGKPVEHAYLGVQLGDASAGGAQIGAVRSGGPADDAGVQRGDVIVAIDGTRVATGDDAVGMIDAAAPGDALTLSVHRDGATRTIRVALGTRPA